ncbi:MAG TPA: Trm112 family protein [Bacteroidota bacterium]|nr:Trm112 family protein [Bacteroidota bacterium]
MISPELLNILCCPKCHGDLAYDQTQNTLTCKSCSRVYPIQNDIPIMLIDNQPSQPSTDDRPS